MVLLEEGVQLKTLREKGDIAPPPHTYPLVAPILG